MHCCHQFVGNIAVIIWSAAAQQTYLQMSLCCVQVVVCSLLFSATAFTKKLFALGLHATVKNVFDLTPIPLLGLSLPAAVNQTRTQTVHRMPRTANKLIYVSVKNFYSMKI